MLCFIIFFQQHIQNMVKVLKHRLNINTGCEFVYKSWCTYSKGQKLHIGKQYGLHSNPRKVYIQTFSELVLSKAI